MTPSDGNSTPPFKPWYRQPWPWFLIALPASSVVAGVATLMIASHNPDPVLLPSFNKLDIQSQRAAQQQLAASGATPPGVILERLADSGLLQVVFDNTASWPASRLELALSPAAPDDARSGETEFRVTLYCAGDRSVGTKICRATQPWTQTGRFHVRVGESGLWRGIWDSADARTDLQAGDPIR